MLESRGEFAHGCLSCAGKPYVDKLFFQEKKISQLELENAELKKKIESMEKER